MYRHVAMFWLKEPSDASIADACALLRSGAARVQGLVAAEIGPQSRSGASACDVCMGLLFADEEAHARYHESPVREALEAALDGRILRMATADYEVREPERRMPRLYAFVGPSNRDPDIMGRLLDAGMDGIRLSLRHLSEDACAELVQALHTQAAKRSITPEVLLDDVSPSRMSSVMAKCAADALILAAPQSDATMADIRKLVGDKTRLMLKVDCPEHVDNLSFFLRHADQIVIVRERMCASFPRHMVPLAQKRVAMRCLGAGVPYMLTHDLLSSMRGSLLPTAAELNDIFSAVQDGVSSLMLTRAVSQGKYPVEAMQALRKAAEAAARQ